VTARTVQRQPAGPSTQSTASGGPGNLEQCTMGRSRGRRASIRTPALPGPFDSSSVPLTRNLLKEPLCKSRFFMAHTSAVQQHIMPLLRQEHVRTSSGLCFLFLLILRFYFLFPCVRRPLCGFPCFCWSRSFRRSPCGEPPHLFPVCVTGKAGCEGE